MLAVPCRADPRAFERRKCQRRLGDRQNTFPRSAELAQKICASLWIVSLRRSYHPSLISEFLYLDSRRRRGGSGRVGHLPAGGGRGGARLGGATFAPPALTATPHPPSILLLP